MGASETGGLVLGLNAYHADAAAVLLRGGVPILGVEEERFTRVKHTAGVPEFAVRACLEAAHAKLSDLDAIAVSSNPDVHLEDEVYFILTGRPNYSGLVRSRLANVARRRDVVEDLCGRLNVERETVRAEVRAVEHPLAHLANAYFSGLAPGEAALLTASVFGDFCSTMTGAGRGGEIVVLEKALFPHSLGLFMTTMAQYLGFPEFGAEGKVMGLAAHGSPRHAEALGALLHAGGPGLVRLDLDFFTHAQQGVDMVWDDLRPHMEPLYSWKLVEAFGPPRQPGDPIEERHRDLAASAQRVLEECLLVVARRLHDAVPAESLAFTGSVAQNSVANSALARRGPFKRVVVPAAPGDSGTALGAALLVHAGVAGASPPRTSPFLGPEFSEEAIAAAIRRSSLPAERVADPVRAAADLLVAGKVIGWFQGRMEWGPRALGNRSILADPRAAAVRERVTRGVKMREPFRPFAAAIPEERAGELLLEGCPSPTMSFVFPVRPEARGRIPAVVHADGTARVQTVARDANPLFHRLLEEFAKRTGVPALLNTSFNENEPMVCTPEDALRCFRETKLDACVLGPFVVKRGG
ncbi:MAG: hypothetical protein L0216_05010 [Planctomycetales bacterium]|nr:hypothetical protein [Planctomycetales bacterium]